MKHLEPLIMLRKHLHLFFLVSRHVYLLLQFASEDRISLYQFIPVYKHCLEKLVPAVSVRRLYVVDTIFCRAWVFAFYMFTGWANNGIFRLILPHFIYYYFIIIIINLCFFALFSEFIYLLLRCLHSDFHVFFIQPSEGTCQASTSARRTSLACASF